VVSGKKSPGTRPTLVDVATRAGVSTAVVSYVVNNGPRPGAPATRRRVEAAIADLGYRPNRVARTLVSQRSGTIGLIVPNTTSAFFTDLVQAVEREAFERGLLTFVGNAQLDLQHEQAYTEAFVSAGVDAVIVASTDVAHPLAHPLTHTGALDGERVVWIHRRPVGARGPLVRGDDRRGGQLATRHLLALGHRTVHCLAGLERSGPVADRVQGWADALGATGEPEPTLRSAYHRAEAARVVGPWLATLQAPAALFVATDEQAIGVLAAAYEAGVRVPHDLAVVSFDGTAAGAFTAPSLTSVALPMPAIAAAAVGMCLQVARGETAGPDEVVVPVELVVRRSCGSAS
jgi:LacI family transcriptional regulator